MLETPLPKEVKGTLTEVKMSRMRKRSEEEQHKKTYKSSDKVTVLGLVCAKMAKRVLLVRQAEEDRQLRLEEDNVATLRMIPEKSRTIKMMRDLQTRETSGRSPT